jgi:hypothetical protein
MEGGVVLHGNIQAGTPAGAVPDDDAPAGPSWSERVPELALGAGVVAAFALTAIMVGSHPTAEAAAFRTDDHHGATTSAALPAVGRPAADRPLPLVLLLPVGEASAAMEDAGVVVQAHAADGSGRPAGDWVVCQAAELPGDTGAREVSLLAVAEGTTCP